MDMKDRGKKQTQSLYKRRSLTPKNILALKSNLPMSEDESIEQKVKKLFSGQDELFERIKPRKSSERVLAAINEIAKISKPLALKAKTSTSRHTKKIIGGIQARRSGKKSQVESLLSTKKISYIVQRTKAHPKAVVGLSAFLAASVFAMLVMVGTRQSAKPVVNSPKSANNNSVTEVAGAKDTKIQPDFAVLLPSAKSIDELGGLKKANPEGSPAAYKFKDKIDAVDILVTQQQIPDSIKTDVQGGVAKIAKDFQATNVIVIDGISAYHGVKEKTGVQSIVTYKGGLLLLIAASSKLSDDKWAAYISSLR